MYKNTDAEIRPELQVVVQEALEANKFLIADKIFPYLGRDRKTGTYRKIKKGTGGILEMSGDDQTVRAPRTPYKEVDRTYEMASFLCQDRGLTEVVDDSDQHDVARFFNAEQTSTKLVIGNILRGQEKRVADTVMNEAIWGAALAPTAAYTAANVTNDTVDVGADFEEAISRIAKRQELLNTIIIPRNVWKRIRTSTKLRKFIFGDNAGGKMVTRAEFLAAFQDSAPIENLYITDSVYANVKKGQQVADADLKYIWPDTYVWFGNVTGGEVDAGGAGRIFYWEEDVEFAYVVESYRDEHRRSDVVRVRQHNAEHVTNECAGFLLKTNYA